MHKISSMNQYSILKFGAHKGKQVGEIFLYDPGYIDWLLRETKEVYLTDIEELKLLKCLEIPATWDSIIASVALERKMLSPINLYNRFEFSDVKYSGKYRYNFTQVALSNHTIKAVQHNEKIIPYTEIDYNNKLILLNFFAGEAILKTEMTYVGSDSTKFGIIYHKFIFSNTDGVINFLPKVKSCLIGISDLKDFGPLKGTKVILYTDNDNIVLDIDEDDIDEIPGVISGTEFLDGKDYPKNLYDSEDNDDDYENNRDQGFSSSDSYSDKDVIRDAFDGDEMAYYI